MNLIVFIGSVSLFMIFILSYVIAFTSLREYILGYADVNMRRNINKLVQRSDSLLQASAEKDIFLANIQKVIEGKITATDIKKLAENEVITVDSSKLNSTDAENDFRKSYEMETKNAASNNTTIDIAKYNFQVPLNGKILQNFNERNKVFGTEILAEPKLNIKATLAGTVIFAGLTNDMGYVIQLQHTDNLISVYKNNSQLLKRVGEKVKDGEAIAIVGKTTQQTTNCFLHFELWYNGKAIDAAKYIKF